MFKRLLRAWFYRWWAVNRATLAEPYANWQASLDFTLWGEAGQELVSIYDREGPFKSEAEAWAACARRNTLAIEGAPHSTCRAQDPGCSSVDRTDCLTCSNA